MAGLGGAAATFVAVGAAAVGGTSVGAGAHAASAATAVNVIPVKRIILKHGRFIVPSPFNCLVVGCKNARAPAPSHPPNVLRQRRPLAGVRWTQGLAAQLDPLS